MVPDINAMSGDKRFYMVEIGNEQFLIESDHPNRAKIFLARLIRKAMTVSIPKPKEAYDLAAAGVPLIRPEEASTWPNMDDRTLIIPGAGMPTTRPRVQTSTDSPECG